MKSNLQKNKCAEKNRLLWILLFFILGCASSKSDQPGTGSDAALSATIPAPVWSENLQYQYHLSLSSEAAVSGQNAMADFDLTATLSLMPRSISEDETELVGRLEQISFTTKDKNAKPTYDKLTEEMTSLFSCTLAHGKNTFVRVAKDISPAGASLVRTLCAAFQVSKGPGNTKTWTAEENDATGKYVVRYELSPSSESLSKKKLQYETSSVKDSMGLGLSMHMDTKVVASAGEVQVKDNALTQVSYNETLEAVMDQKAPIVSTTKLLLTLKDRDNKAGAVAVESIISSSNRMRADEPYMKVSATDYSFDKEKIGSLTFDEMLRYFEEDNASTLASAGTGSDDEKQERIKADGRMFTALSALLRTDPVNADKAADAIKKGSKATASLLDALGSAGSDAAQNALIAVGLDKALSEDVRKQAVKSLTWTRNASDETVDLLLSLAEDTAVGDQMVLGLGTLARHLREEKKTQQSDRVSAFLVEKLKSAGTTAQTVRVLRGIANSGFNGAFNAVKPFFASPDENVRASSIEAIRLMTKNEVDKTIADTMKKDGSIKVRLAAVNAAKVRQPGDALINALSHTALEAKDSMSRQRALRVMIAWLPEHPEIKKTLTEVAERDDNSGIRKAAEAALVSGGEGV